MKEKLQKKLDQLKKEQSDLAVQYKKIEQMLFKYDGAIEAIQILMKEDEEVKETKK